MLRWSHALRSDQNVIWCYILLMITLFSPFYKWKAIILFYYLTKFQTKQRNLNVLYSKLWANYLILVNSWKAFSEQNEKSISHNFKFVQTSESSKPEIGNYINFGKLYFNQCLAMFSNLTPQSWTFAHIHFAWLWSCWILQFV